MSVFKQAERLTTDGPISVGRPREGWVSISVTNFGEVSTIELSEYNASRAFGMLALMLGIGLSKAVGKAIRL